MKMDPTQFFIRVLAGVLVKQYELSPEAWLAEATRVGAERHNEIAQAMRLGYGVIVFIAASYRLEATLDKHGMTRLRRLDLVWR
jgi:hypothetical protein